MKKSTEELASDFNIKDPDNDDPDRVYEAYDAMREQGPFAHSSAYDNATASDIWISTRYEESYKILKDWKTFSSAKVGTYETLPGNAVLQIDPPAQQRFRRVLNPYFTPSIMDPLETHVREAMTELIDSFIESGTGDLADLAWKLPGMILFQYVLGMPVDAVPKCLSLLDTEMNDSDDSKRLEAILTIREEVASLVKRRIDMPPQGDVIDVLLEGEIDGRPMEFEDIVANAYLLIAAGLETTSNALSVAYHFLGTHPIERDRLASDSSLIPTAVEEFVRYSGSVHGLQRVATEEVEIGGHKFCPGDTIVVSYAAANRDPREFPEANRCIVDRTNNRHLGFGAGPHRCLGSNLARLELRIALEEVLRRIPDYKVKDESQLEFHGAAITRGYHSLPVVFTPGNRLAAG